MASPPRFGPQGGVASHPALYRVQSHQPAIGNPPVIARVQQPRRSLESIRDPVKIRNLLQASIRIHVGERQHRSRVVLQRFDKAGDIGGFERIVMKRKEQVIAVRGLDQAIDVANPAKPCALPHDAAMWMRCGKRLADIRRIVRAEIDGHHQLQIAVCLRSNGLEHRRNERARIPGRHAGHDSRSRSSRVVHAATACV